ncbi:MAG: hypothetical protein ACKVU1_01280 [bacterium]
MKIIAVLGILLALLGVIGLVQKSVTYTKDKDTAKIGPLELTVTERETVALPFGVSVALLAGGLLMFAVGTNRTRV